MKGREDRIDLDFYHSPARKKTIVQYGYTSDVLFHDDDEHELRFEAMKALMENNSFGEVEEPKVTNIATVIISKDHDMSVGEWVEERISKELDGQDFTLVELKSPMDEMKKIEEIIKKQKDG